jgi:hypothetical protein
MEKKENSKSSGKRAVKDLTLKSAGSVKGGLYCATGEHLKKAL